STTSTSGVMLMAACILTVSPSRMGFCLQRYLNFLLCNLWVPELPLHDLRHFEQAVHELGGGPIHLDLKSLEPAGEVIKSDHGGDRDEDAERCRDQSLGNTARDHRHSARARGCDVPESVDDSGHRAKEPDERGCRTDRGQEPESPLQLDQGLGNRVSECTRDELEGGDWIAAGLTHAVVLQNAG